MFAREKRSVFFDKYPYVVGVWTTTGFREFLFSTLKARSAFIKKVIRKRNFVRFKTWKRDDYG